MAKYWFKASNCPIFVGPLRGYYATTWQGWTFTIGMTLLWMVGSSLTTSWLQFAGLLFFVVATALVVVRLKTNWSRE